MSAMRCRNFDERYPASFYSALRQGALRSSRM